ncbi:MAG: hypothetical protein WC548_01115 [Candidatus Pacearchaeota archaeon]
MVSIEVGNIELLEDMFDKTNSARNYDATICLPQNRSLSLFLCSRKTSYSGDLSVHSKYISDFLGFVGRTKKHLRKVRSPWEAHEVDNRYLVIMRRGQNFFDYGLELIPEKKGAKLSLLLGQNGTLPRNVRDLKETINEFSNLASIVFYDYLIIPGVPASTLIYI